MQFQAVCSKWSKKLTLSINAHSIDEAKRILHSQGYSIIEIKEVSDTSLSQWGNFFFFDVVVNGVVQTGKIQSDDIFKAYRKLVEDLKYMVRYIYTSPNATDEQKKIITAKVKDGYRLYVESMGGEIVEEPKKNLTIDEQEIQDFSPQLLRELEKYSKLIDDTIEKIQNLLIRNHETIEPRQKSQLERIELELVQIKGTKNFWKIQWILEDSLKQVGAIELDILKKWMIKEKEQFLLETNQLLKEIWSGERIQTEEQKQKSVEYQLGSFFEKIKTWGSREKEVSPGLDQKKKVDTHSFIYLKNKRELDIYKKSLSKNDREIISALFSFRWKQLKRLFLKRKLLSQNIQIIDNRIKNKNISYTRIIHGVGRYGDMFFSVLQSMATLMFSILFLFTLTYILLTTADSLRILEVTFVEKSMFLVTIFSIFVACFLFVRNWITFIFTGILFVFLLGFFLTNF